MRVEPSRWTQANRRLPVLTLYAPPGHTLCLGDNSPQSSDRRFWGPVPDRLVLGPVSFIYWPPARFGEVR
jgi:type IV secretory pathway protease TraF